MEECLKGQGEETVLLGRMWLAGRHRIVVVKGMALGRQAQAQVSLHVPLVSLTLLISKMGAVMTVKNCED